MGSQLNPLLPQLNAASDKPSVAILPVSACQPVSSPDLILHHGQAEATASPISIEDEILPCAKCSTLTSSAREPPVGQTLGKPINLKVCSKVIPSFDAESPLTPGLHAAELFADQLLCSPQVPTKADLCHLHSMLPLTHSSRFEGGSTFTAGVFRHGGVIGLHKATNAFPLSVQVINRFLKDIDPTFEFCSVALNMNVMAAAHRDSNNASPTNLVVGLSAFKGGAIWVQSEANTHRLQVHGETLLGDLADLAEGPQVIKAKSAIHATLPWQGDRLVLIAFSGGDANLLPARDYQFLLTLGFRPSVSSGTSAPPCLPLYPVPRELADLEHRVRARIAGRPINELLFVEIFAGTGGFCAAIRRLGLRKSFGIDHQVCKGSKCPIAVLDLTQESAQAILFEILADPATMAVHLGPPCGTSSAARCVPGGPPPLRTAAQPDGVDHLTPLQQLRVVQANILYSLTARVLAFCFQAGILTCTENPSRSIFWLTSPMRAVAQIPMIATHLHHCMVGSTRRKATTLQHTIPEMQRLQLPCTNDHVHEPWGRLSDGSWATSAEVHYPPAMCTLLATSVFDQLLRWGAVAPADRLGQSVLSLTKAAQVATDKQPPGKRVLPLVPEFKVTYTLRGPARLLPLLSDKRLLSDYVCPKGIQATPSAEVLPAGSRCIRSNLVGKPCPDFLNLCREVSEVPSTPDSSKAALAVAVADPLDPVNPSRPEPAGVVPNLGPEVNPSRPEPAGVALKAGSEPTAEMVVGVYRSPDEFLKEACFAKHPRSLIQGVPEPLHQCIASITSQSLADIAKLRTAALRKWVQRAKEIRQSDKPTLEPEPHCKEILRSKNMTLFGEMLTSVGYRDTALVSEICKGFDLLGPVPSSGVLPSKTTVATLTKEDVRQSASLNRKIALDAMSRCGDPEVAREVYNATLDERDRGWVRGPIPLDQIPEHSILTRRFGVIQSSTGEGGEQIRKVRPIDDYTQSLANLTASSCETIAPHGVDTIMAGLLLRLRQTRLRGRRPSIKLRTIDLRKAYKQLPLSLEALGDAYICIHNPDTHQAEVYQTLVLPFGARPAVQAFCRTSAALWHLGITILWLPWTVYFDDYVLSGEEEECRHLDFIQAGFFQLMGWETSAKDSGFSFTAKALGVEICLGEAHLGLLAVQNTESSKCELAAAITHVLNTRGAPSKDFECLRGRMLFAEGQIFGRRANQSMKILSAACRNAGYVKLTPDLEHALIFLRDRVVSAPPRMLRANDRPCFHLFTDASRALREGWAAFCTLHPAFA